MEELRQERERTKATDEEARRDAPLPRVVASRWPPPLTSAGTGRVRQSGVVRS
jgi:hypothetical protein